MKREGSFERKKENYGITSLYTLIFNTIFSFSLSCDKFSKIQTRKIFSLSSCSPSNNFEFPSSFFTFNSSHFHMFLLIRRYLPSRSVYSVNCSSSNEINEIVKKTHFFITIKAAMTDTEKIGL